MIRKKANFLSDKENWQYVNWKSVPMLKKYISRFDNIKPRKYSVHSVTAQKKLRKEIIRAREIGLLPYAK